MTELLGLASLWARRTDRNLIRQLEEGGATSPGSAVPLGRSLGDVERSRLDRLVELGVVVETSRGAYHLDLDRLRELRRRGRWVYAFVLGVAAMAMALAWM